MMNNQTGRIVVFLACFTALLFSRNVFAQLSGKLNITFVPISESSVQPNAGLDGTALSPDIRVSPAEKNYGNVIVGGSSSFQFLVSNTGFPFLNISAVEGIGPDTDQFSVDGPGGEPPPPPPYSLPPGATVGVTVSFRPTSLGAKSAVIRITSNDPDESPFDVALSGVGVGPEIDISPTDNDYGYVQRGSYSSQTFVVNNTGTADLSVTSTSLVDTDAGQYTIDSGGGSFTLAPGATHDMVVSFCPTAPGDKSATLRIASNDVDENPFDIPLSGTGVEPEIAVSPTSKNYGKVLTGSNFSQNFMISNTGTADLTVSSTTLVGTDAGQYTIDSGGGLFTLAPGETQELVVSFRPTTLGAKNATLRITNDDPDDDRFDVPLSGIGTAPDIVVNPATKDFAVVILGDSVSAIFWVKNRGDADLNITSTILMGPNASDFSIDGIGTFTVPPNESSGVAVNFSPAALGLKTATLQIFNNDPDENPVNIPLSGSCSENGAPYLVFYYPSDSAKAVAKNAPIQFKVTDSGSGIDLSSVNLQVAGTFIVKNGIDQTNGRVAIDSHRPQFSLLYKPESNFSQDSVVVQISCNDLAVPANSMSANYFFKVDTAIVNISQSEVLGPEGGKLTDPLSGIQVMIPPAALKDTLQIMLGTVSGQSALPSGANSIGPAYYFAPDGLQFADSVIIAVPYLAQQLADYGISNPLDLWIYHFSTFKAEWQQRAPFNADADYVYVKMSEFCYLILATTTEQITATLRVSGPDIVYATYPFRFSVNNLQTNYGHSLEYQFIWGDGTLSAWSADTSVSHIWANTGFYDVSVRGRCQSDTTIGTVSDSLKVKVDVWTGMADQTGDQEPPAEFDIEQNYPNPFNPMTTIKFQIPVNAHVRITIYDILGKKVKTLIDEERPAGHYQVVWETANPSQDKMATGVYLCHFVAAHYNKFVKMLFIR